MFGARRLSRRAIIGSGLIGAIAIIDTALQAETYIPIQCWGPVRSADGEYKPQSCDRIDGSSIWAYLGIRYARAERFRAPVAVTTAEQVGPNFPVCPQVNPSHDDVSEDCLFLNIWTKEGPKKKRPVMVYFHGGAYSTGSVTDPLNDGEALAARGDVVVVTVNHRLNAFGYLYMPDRFPDSGNAGQLDLILALRWVQPHYASFGADPQNGPGFGASGRLPAGYRLWSTQRGKTHFGVSGKA